MYTADSTVIESGMEAGLVRSRPEPRLVPAPLVPSPPVQSPSLIRGHAAAHEMKFLLSEAQAQQVEQQLRGHLTLDANANPDQHNGYQLSTLYCDTPAMDVFHRRGRYGLFKFRVRRYGDSDTVFLEQKLKHGTEVRKHRIQIGVDEVSRFERSLSVNGKDEWNGATYHRALQRHSFRPVCLIDYHRVAYFADSADGPVRLTFDRHVRGSRSSQWSFNGDSVSQELLPDQVVCEFKYRGPLPTLFKSVIQSLQMTPRGVSKYRRWVETCQP